MTTPVIAPAAARRGGGARRRVSIAAAVGLATLGTGLVARAQAAPLPTLTMVAATPNVTMYQGDYFADYGMHVIAGSRAIVVTAARKDLGSPVVATLSLGEGRSAQTRKLAPSLADMSGFKSFLHVTARDQSGAVVLQQDQDWLPGGGYYYSGAARYRPEAPDNSPWPSAGSGQWSPTGANFALSNIFGLQAGWSSPAIGLFSWFSPTPPPALALGTYTVTQTINPAWREVLDITAAQASATVTVNVIPYPYQGASSRAAAGTTGGPGSVTPLNSVQAGQAQDVARRARLSEVQAASGGRQPVVSTDPNNQKVPNERPDLRANPAFGVNIFNVDQMPLDPSNPGIPGHDYLAFSATVWNGGTSPMVVEGSRAPGANVMQSRQYFYDKAGHQLGWTPVGSMQYDARPGHEHWHFLDFAQYNLLDSAKVQTVRSQKEAFCIAPTDAIDLASPYANWQPGTLGFYSRCGGPAALAVREALDVGWGDTYGQYLPGQSFDITDLPNGTYYIQVKVNPAGSLYETDKTNNESLRQIVLGGTTGARTVTVPPYLGIDLP